MTTICIFLIGVSQMLCITSGGPATLNTPEHPELVYLSYYEIVEDSPDIVLHSELLYSSLEETRIALLNDEGMPDLSDYDELTQEIMDAYKRSHDDFERLRPFLQLTPVIIEGSDPIFFFPDPVYDPMDPIEFPAVPPTPWGMDRFMFPEPVWPFWSYTSKAPGIESLWTPPLLQ